MKAKMKFKHTFSIEGPNGVVVDFEQAGGVFEGTVTLLDAKNRLMLIENAPQKSESMALLMGEEMSVEILKMSAELQLEMGFPADMALLVCQNMKVVKL